jgi:phage repressor protein C with HTH and peptisase S24 domain
MKAVERILQYIDYKGLNNSSFEKKIGVSNGYIATQSKRNADLGEGILNKILDNSLDINPEWLLTGKGEMLKVNPELYKDHQNRSIKGNLQYASEENSRPKRGIPLIPIEAMAGFGSGEVKVMDYDLGEYVVPEFDELKVDFMITVRGSSMYPKYSSGDLVACKKIAMNDIFFQWNKVYVLDTEQGALIKRVDIGRDDEHILIVSENEKYKPFQLHKSKIYAIAIVVGVIRLE